MQTIKEPKYRASHSSKSRNQTIYWLAAAILAAGLAWIWWGQQNGRKTAAKKVEKTIPAKPGSMATSNVPGGGPKTQTPPITEVVRVTPLPKVAPPQEIVRTNAVAVTPAPKVAPLTESARTNGVRVTPLPKVAPVQESVRSNAPAKPPSLQWTKILEMQSALMRAGISPGSLDGVMGSQTRWALRAFQQMAGLPTTGTLDAETESRLFGSGHPLGSYVVTEEDFDRLLPLSHTWLGKSQQERLDYETILELVAEKFHASPTLIKKLNPGVVWTSVAPGTALVVPVTQYPAPIAKAAYLKIFVGSRFLQAYDADDRVLAHFPCSIAQRVEKRPIGEELHVAVLAPNPNYTFDPAVFPESAEAQQLGRKLILQPGPNNPVGTVWIGLDKPGYGIHGTPQPEAVGRTESHGCFRLANWNAEYLLKLVSLGTPVLVEP